MLSIMMERLKSPKIALFDYTDEYSREWFKNIYNLHKITKLNKLNVSSDIIVGFLKKVSQILS